jgi:hypothetical protein
VRLATEQEEIHRLGGEIVAVTVDSPGRNAALARRWRLPFAIHSDPGGERILQPLELWNALERGGIAWPALLVVHPDGREVYRYRSRDFADRPTDDDLLAVLAAQSLPACDLPPPWDPGVEPVEDAGALRVDAFGPFFRGIRSGTGALAGRLETNTDQAEAKAMRAMAASFLDAWKTWREQVSAP